MSIAVAVLAFLSGSFAGSVLTVAVAGYREKRQRRSDFRGFLGGWLGCSKAVTDPRTLHADNLRHLWGYYGRLYRDFSAIERQEVKRICEDLTAISEQQFADYHQSISSEINALINLV